LTPDPCLPHPRHQNGAESASREGGSAYRFLLVFLDRDARTDGTLAPFSRASLSPIAMACLRLVTFRPDPLFSVPFFRRCIADFTVLDADFPYFAMSATSIRWCVAGMPPASGAQPMLNAARKT
jgi:hypothetical protein